MIFSLGGTGLVPKRASASFSNFPTSQVTFWMARFLEGRLVVELMHKVDRDVLEGRGCYLSLKVDFILSRPLSTKRCRGRGTSG